MNKNPKRKRRGQAQGTTGGNLEQQALALPPPLPNRGRQSAKAKQETSPLAPVLSAKGVKKEETVRVCRNATERLLALHQLISARKYPNTVRMAREFDVSQKTVKRDVEWMRVHYDLPIEYDRERHGYYYSCEVTRFPG